MNLSFDPDTVLLPIGHFIGGELVGADGAIEMRRPSDGKAYVSCPVANADTIDRAVESAKAALKAGNWSGVRPRERTKALQAWADLIEAEAETLAKIEALSSTRPVGQLVAGDIAVTAEQIRFFAEFADKEGSDVAPTDDVSFGMTLSDPYGVVGAITPWNFPVSIRWKLGPALAAGNPVVLRPSEMTSFSTVFMAQLPVSAGLPAGLVDVVLTEDEALTLAGHLTYGLAAGLFKCDLSRTIRLARRLEAGTAWINRYSRSRDHILPTGGYKRSGIGKDLGREA